MGKIDIVYGLLLGAFSLLFFGATMKFPKSSGGIDPRVFPLVVIAATFALSVLLIIQGMLRTVRGQVSQEKTLPRGKIALKLLTIVGAGLLYAAVLDAVGYVLATPLIMALGMYFFGERKPLRIALVSVLVSAALYLVFRGVFRVPLPRSFFW
jgi:putative tricarboxylic transport membrane protein